MRRSRGWGTRRCSCCRRDLWVTPGGWFQGIVRVTPKTLTPPIRKVRVWMGHPGRGHSSPQVLEGHFGKGSEIDGWLVISITLKGEQYG